MSTQAQITANRANSENLPGGLAPALIRRFADHPPKWFEDVSAFPCTCFLSNSYVVCNQVRCSDLALRKAKSVRFRFWPRVQRSIGPKFWMECNAKWKGVSVESTDLARSWAAFYEYPLIRSSGSIERNSFREIKFSLDPP